VVTPEGRALLDQLQADREREGSKIAVFLVFFKNDFLVEEIIDIGSRRQKHPKSRGFSRGLARMGCARMI
jgi:hypothetical protein